MDLILQASHRTGIRIEPRHLPWGRDRAGDTNWLPGLEGVKSGERAVKVRRALWNPGHTP